MNALKQKKTGIFHVRITGELRERLDKITAVHKVEDPAIAELALTAFCDTVERREKVFAPYTMLDAHEVAHATGQQLLQLVAETQAHYGGDPPSPTSSSPDAEKHSA